MSENNRKTDYMFSYMGCDDHVELVSDHIAIILILADIVHMDH